MGEKKNKSEGEQKQTDQKNNDGGKKDGGQAGVVLRIDMHCEGCATKIKKCIRNFEGVETLKGDEKDASKVTVTGKVDPVKLREKLEQKTRKKVELLSPLPKKDKEKEKEKEKDKDKEGGGGEKNAKDKPEKKPDEKKSKEPPVTTVALKVNLHCEGCIQKINKVVKNTKGCQVQSIDRQKDLVTVKGTMDAKALAESLKEKLKKPVEIVPPKKEGGGGGGGGEKKEKGDGGGGDEKKKKGGGGGDKAVVDDGLVTAEESRVEYMPPYGYPYPYVYGAYEAGYPAQVHAPQLFSDENPNACSVM